jgi:hypothetical protein
MCGYAIETRDKLIFIPMVEAISEGIGAVGKFLDVISTRCRTINVMSGRLEEMLKQRDFRHIIRRTVDGPVDTWAPPRELV